MRVCLVGSFKGNCDEGMKRVASHLKVKLSENHEVLVVDAKGLLSRSEFRALRDFNPDIVHYVPGPSILSFLAVKAVKLRCREAKTVMSAMHPAFYGIRGLTAGSPYALSFLLGPLVPFLRPDVVLTQSHESERAFVGMGCRTVFFPCGVDVDKFAPVSKATKKRLREKYQINETKTVLLHVGHIRGERNIELLPTLQSAENQVLIVGSTTTGGDRQMVRKLESEGCLVWTTYIENIEEVYALADLYVFPTSKRIGSIEMPLSVLEAMSSNLPVVSTRFGALPRVFSEGESLAFADSGSDFYESVQRLKRSAAEPRTREKVLPYSWDRIAKELEEIYWGLCDGQVVSASRLEASSPKA